MTRSNEQGQQQLSREFPAVTRVVAVQLRTTNSEKGPTNSSQPDMTATWKNYLFLLGSHWPCPLHAVTTRHTLKAFGYTIIAKLITSYTQGHTVDTHVRRHCARLHGTCNVHPN